MIRRLGLAAALCVLALGAARAEDMPDVPPGDVALRGRLVHTGGAQVAGTPVILYSLSPQGEPGLRTTQSDARGEFAFEKISGDPAIVYLVGTRVGGVPYGVRAAFAAGEREHRVELAIAEPTEDVSHLSRGDVRVRLQRGCTHLRVQQSQALENRSQRVLYVPPERRSEAAPLLRAELPEGAEGFEPIATAGVEGLEQAGRAVSFWGPLHPGRHEIEWGFGLPLQKELALRIGLPDGAPGASLLLPAGATARGPGLSAEGTRDLPSGRQVVYAVRHIAPGGALEALLAIPEGGSLPGLRVDEARVWLELDDAALDVSEQLTLHVDGDQALVSEAGPLLCLPLPAEAQELRFATGSLGLGLTRDPSGALALSGPIPPGETPLSLRYQLPSGGSATRFSRSYASEVPLLQVFVADTGLRVQSPRMHRKRPVVTEDRVYLELEAFSIAPGEEVEISLEALPARGGPARALALGVVVLGALGAGAFLLTPLRSGPEPLGSAQESAAAAERESLYRSIEGLDEDLETGKLSARDHAELRAGLRARAVASLASERRREQDATAAPPSGPPACASCGAALRPDDRFCSQCGALRGAPGQSAG